MNSILKVAIQGDRASFHEIAAHQYYQQPIQLLYCTTFAQAFEHAAEGRADRAFVAKKNSAHGVIEEVDVLLGLHSALIKGEYDLSVEQHLIGLPGALLEDVRVVISHPVALSQCDLYLSAFNKMHYHDTSAAAAYVKNKSDTTFAAVGSEAAAKLHGLKILRRAIQNDPNNVTTFADVMLIDLAV